MSSRGIVNGEIRDRTHLFTILGFIFILFLGPVLPLFSGFEMLANAPSNRWYHNSGENLEVRGAIIFLLGVFIFLLILFFVSREFAFIRINKKKIIIKRPLLALFPFSKSKSNVELSTMDIGELKIRMLYRGVRWYFIDKSGNELLKLNFKSENNFTPQEWKDSLEKTEIALKVTWDYYWKK